MNLTSPPVKKRDKLTETLSNPKKSTSGKYDLRVMNI